MPMRERRPVGRTNVLCVFDRRYRLATPLPFVDRRRARRSSRDAKERLRGACATMVALPVWLHPMAHCEGRHAQLLTERRTDLDTSPRLLTAPGSGI